jgi:hypothetical protein
MCTSGFSSFPNFRTFVFKVSKKNHSASSPPARVAHASDPAPPLAIEGMRGGGCAPRDDDVR